MKPLCLQFQYRVFNRRINRDQWDADSGVPRRYEEMAAWSWDETREKAPDYFQRLQASIKQTHGHVLEIGCGIGNMTKWIAERPEVTGVVAVDGYQAAVKRLESFALPKVDTRLMPADGLQLGSSERFDCVVICELIEHLYPDEEAAMIRSIRPHMAPHGDYVVSAPIGWLEDPHHVRAFSKRGLQRHVERYYGPVEGSDVSSGYSQVVWGRVRQG